MDHSIRLNSYKEGGMLSGSSDNIMIHVHYIYVYTYIYIYIIYVSTYIFIYDLLIRPPASRAHAYSAAGTVSENAKRENIVRCV